MDMKLASGKLHRNSWVTGMLAVLYYPLGLKGQHGIKEWSTLSPYHQLFFPFFFPCIGVTFNTATLTTLQSQFLGPYRLTDRIIMKTTSCPHGLFKVSMGLIPYKLPFSRIWKMVCLNFCWRILSCKSKHIPVINPHTLFKGHSKTNHCHTTDSM